MYKHCESVAFYDKRHRFSEDDVISALSSGIRGQKVNSDADKLLVEPFCFLYSDKIIQSIKTSLIPEES